MGRTERLDLAFTRTDSTDGAPACHPDDMLRLYRKSTIRSQSSPYPPVEDVTYVVNQVLYFDILVSGERLSYYYLW